MRERDASSGRHPHGPHAMGCTGLFAAAAVATGMTFGGVVQAQGQDGAQGEIILGALQPLSGPFASLGEQTLQGVRYAVEEVNANGGIRSLGGRRVRLVVADSTTDDQAAATSAANKLLASKPVAIVGPTSSSALLPASTVTERARVPMCTQSFSDRITERGYRYIFQTLPKGSTIANFTVPVIRELAPLLRVDPKKIALLYDDTAGTVALFSNLGKGLEAAGLRPVYNEKYNVGLTNATFLAAAVKASGAELLVQGSSSPQDMSLIARALRDQGVKLPVLNPSGGSANATFIKSVGPSVNGSFIIATWLASMNLTSSQNSLLKTFDEEVAKKYDVPFAGNFAGQGYVCTSQLLAAIDKAASTEPDKVRNQMATMKFESGGGSLMPPGVVEYNDAGVAETVVPLVGQWCRGKINTVLPSKLASGPPQDPASCQ